MDLHCKLRAGLSRVQKMMVPVTLKSPKCTFVARVTHESIPSKLVHPTHWTTCDRCHTCDLEQGPSVLSSD